jgi:inositol-1,3,4-trisphosphate 5/6-kinase
MKQATASLVCIGYSMKESRQKTLTQQDMLPFLPIDGIFFLPLDPYTIAQPPFQNKGEEDDCNLIQLAGHVVDVFLHKATDFFQNKVENNHSEITTAAVTANGSVPQYRPELHFLIEKLQLSGCYIIDPLETLKPVIDRVQMSHDLDAACKAARKLALPVRIPAWHYIEHKFSPEILRTASSVSKVSLPCVVKPQVACGVDESHQMAFVLHPSGLHLDLEVPLPALVQEYVDHKSIVWKVYVAGNQVFSVQKRSTPDLQPLRDFLALHLSSGGHGGGGNRGDTVEEEEEDEDLDIPTSIEFNSLESLPVSLPWLSRIMDPGAPAASAATAPPPTPPPAGVMHPGFLTQLAQVFRKHLGLTLFGFDVVFDYAAGEAVVLDLNFFPSFRGIPEAPVALRRALLAKYKEHKKNTSVVN